MLLCRPPKLSVVARCSGRVRIVITTLPWLQREVVTTFKVWSAWHVQCGALLTASRQ
jgi:hypothetical protein